MRAVLLYHSVSTTSSSRFSIDPAAFEKQMRWLSSRFRIVQAGELLHALQKGGRDHLASVQFDDGYRDNLTVMLPIIERLRVPVTVFLTTGLMGKTLRDREMLTWDEAREIQASGLVEFGSHTHTHLLLDSAEAEAAREEIVLSKEIIEQELGTPARFFTYPKGRICPETREIVAAEFEGAFGGGNRAIGRQEDIFNIPRISINQNTPFWKFRLTLNPLIWHVRQRYDL